MAKNKSQTEKKSAKARKEELKAGFEDLKSREREVRSQELMSKNRVKRAKIEAIQSLMGILENLGVDPSNMASVNAFLTQLREQEPDFALLFEMVFNNLTTGLEEGQQQEAMATEEEYQNAGLMNKYRNLGPEMMRSR